MTLVNLIRLPYIKALLILTLVFIPGAWLTASAQTVTPTPETSSEIAISATLETPTATPTDSLTATAIPATTTPENTAIAEILVETQVEATATSVKPVPLNQPDKGLIYDGLIAADGVCGPGQFQIIGTDLCTHGPDPVPPGGSILQGAALVEGVSAASVTCFGDGTSGNRVQVLYVRASDRTNRYSDVLATIQQRAAEADAIFNNSAAETGGNRHIKYVHDANCNVTVPSVQVSTTGDDNITNTINELGALGYNLTSRKYLIFMDANLLCGVGTIQNDDRTNTNNRNNIGPSYARVDTGCWSAGPAAHELMHNLGGVQLSAPHTSQGYHCVDEYDVMCYSDSPNYPSMQIVCSNSHENLFDCNHDDYYHTNPASGSYLATHWNSANNAFLFSGSPAVHDDFNASKQISTLPYQDTVDTTLATTASDDPTFSHCGAGQGLNTVWYRFTAPRAGRIHIDTFNSTYDTMVAVWKGSRGSLTPVGRCNDNFGSGVQSSMAAGVTSGTTYYIEVAQYSASGTSLQSSGINNGEGDVGSLAGGNLTLHVRYTPTSGDLDGDGISDTALFYNNGTWSWLSSSTNFTTTSTSPAFNTGGGAIPQPGNDFDGDGRTDPSVYYPDWGQLYWRLSTTGAQGSFGYFTNTARPVAIAANDYDGDSKSDPALFYPATGIWSWKNSSNNTDGVAAFSAANNPTPIGNADMNGDGRSDPALFYSSTGIFAWNASGTGGTAAFNPQGHPTPFLADFDGDNKSDPAVYYQDWALWAWKRSSDGQMNTAAFNPSGGPQPVVGYFDSDNKADPGLYYASLGLWAWKRSTDGQIGTAAYNSGGNPEPQFGNDFDGDGKADPALYYRAWGLWAWKDSSTGTNRTAPYGPNGNPVVIGGLDFDGDGKTDPGLYYRDFGLWAWQKSSDGTVLTKNMNSSGSPIPVR